MLLKPPVSEEAALEWLKARVTEAYGIEITSTMEAQLKRTAEAMARVSAVELGEEVESLLI
jgi:hypothetical protein